MTEKIVEATVGFWAGLIVGMICGTVVGGVALIGQGVWESGRHWGYAQCERELK